ncbi:hypothetical protein MW887_008099 [Aspergillus wentii]|nr:hypothetical protein MW887_008099 [Aspergillus wentii]
MSPTLGWYGLGSMGLGMASNLQKHLQSQNLSALHYSNRTLSRGNSLKELGAIPEDDFESVVKKADIIFTMISDDAVLDEIISKATSVDSVTGKIFVDTSTVHPDTAASASAKLAQHGAVFISSPVFGASAVAAAGKLIFVMAGPANALEIARPYIIDVMGRSIINMGEDVRKSSLLKISGNIIVISLMQTLSETHVFAERTGLGTAQIEQFISDMFGPVLESYSKRITTGAYAPPRGTPPGFAARLASKDTGHALAIAKEHNVRLGSVEMALGRLERAREYAGEELDSSAMYGTARMEAGMSFWSENSRQE